MNKTITGPRLETTAPADKTAAPPMTTFYPLEQLAMRLGALAPGWDIQLHDDYLEETMLVVSVPQPVSSVPDFLITYAPANGFTLRMVLADRMTDLGRNLSADEICAAIRAHGPAG